MNHNDIFHELKEGSYIIVNRDPYDNWVPQHGKSCSRRRTIKGIWLIRKDEDAGTIFECPECHHSNCEILREEVEVPNNHELIEFLNQTGKAKL